MCWKCLGVEDLGTTFSILETYYILVICDSQVLAKLGVVTIFFIGWGGGGGITKSLPGILFEVGH